MLPATAIAGLADPDLTSIVSLQNKWRGIKASRQVDSLRTDSAITAPLLSCSRSASFESSITALVGSAFAIAQSQNGHIFYRS